MKTFTEIEINGINYPMKFTLGAIKSIEEKYGSMNNWIEEASKKEITSLLWTLKILIENGIKAKRKFEQCDLEPPTDEDLDILDISDSEIIANKIGEIHNLGNAVEVKTKEDKKVGKEKNEVSTK